MGNAELNQLSSDDEAEKLALAAVEAINKLIAALVAKESEVKRVHERFILVRDSYRKLANELVAQLQLFERLEREEARDSGGAELYWLRGEPRD
jgi:hypothetical protein